MIQIKDNTLKRISTWIDSSIYILMDFDRTLTTKDSENSWSVISKNNQTPKEYTKKTYELFKYYRPYEIDETIDYNTKSNLMNEWWNKHINLFSKYQISKDIIENKETILNSITFRKGTKEFFQNMNERNIPIIIVSAGIGNIIESSLILNDCYFDNIHIIANFFKYENNIVKSISGNIIHSLNKSEVSMTTDILENIKNRNNIILIGDAIADIQMAKKEHQKNALKIGFLETNVEENKPYYEKYFDIVCTDNTSYNELTEKINLLNRHL